MKIILWILAILFAIPLSIFIIYHYGLYEDQVESTKRVIESRKNYLVNQPSFILDNINATNIESSLQTKYGFHASKTYDSHLNKIHVHSMIKKNNLRLSFTMYTLASDPSQLLELSLSVSEKSPLGIHSLKSDPSQILSLFVFTPGDGLLSTYPRDVTVNYFTYSASLLFSPDNAKIAEQWISEELSKIPEHRGETTFLIDDVTIKIETIQTILYRDVFYRDVFYRKMITFSKKKS